MAQWFWLSGLLLFQWLCGVKFLSEQPKSKAGGNMNIVIIIVALAGLVAILIGILAMGVGVFNDDPTFFVDRLGSFSAIVGITLWMGIITLGAVKQELKTEHLTSGTVSVSEEIGK
jgi:hypothetical protein